MTCTRAGHTSSDAGLTAPGYLLEEAFVAKATTAFNDPQVAVFCGKRRELNPRASAFNQVLDRDWLSPPGPDRCRDRLDNMAILEKAPGRPARPVELPRS